MDASSSLDLKGVLNVQDLVSVVMLSLPCGWICTLVGLPPMFGYIICGVLLGPSGLNSIKVTLCNSACRDKSVFIDFVCLCQPLSLCPAVDGPGGDSWRAGCVLHSVCGWAGVLTRAPPKSKQRIQIKP